MWKSNLPRIRSTSDGISVAVDNTTYCNIKPPFYERHVNGRTPTAAGVWQLAGSHMAPYDRAFSVTLGVGVGGLKDFSDQPHRQWRAGRKPWRNDDKISVAARKFWDSVNMNGLDERSLDGSSWPGNDAKLLVDYVRVYAL